MVKADSTAHELVDRLFDAVNRRDLNSLTDCFATDYVNETPQHPSRSFRGRAQVAKNWGAILDGVPDIRAEIIRASYSTEEAWVECELTGRRRDGVPYLMRGVVIFRVLGGRIVSARFYLDAVDGENISIDAAVTGTVGTPRAETSGEGP